MALPREAYEALEDIVGPDNISEHPADLDTYAFQRLAELKNRATGKFLERPEAVLLPGSTEEVQAIVKMANKYKFRVKAYSTGWGYGEIQEKNMVQLDMRRMNRILEIDVKNQFAVVEPYVINAQLQAEAMKVGLNVHQIGAGAGCSPLATATSFAGPGPDSIFMGHSAENLLAVEWVMPTGEILRTGSLGSGAGWFCGEGPGPSTRGVFRGEIGAKACLGVFTKCAIKLYPWPGPPEIAREIEGGIPTWKYPLLDNFKTYTLGFPTWEACVEAMYKIYDADIGYIAHRQFNLFGEDLQAAVCKILTDRSKTLDDLEEILKDPEVQKMTEEMRISFQFVLAGMTLRDIEYQERVLDEILAETGGWKVRGMSEAGMERWTFTYLVRMGMKSLNFIYTGAYKGCFTQVGTPDFVMRYIPVAKEVAKKYQERGVITDTGADCMMGGISGFGGGGNMSMEQFIHYDPHVVESVKGALDLFRETIDVEEKIGIPPGLEAEVIPIVERRGLIHGARPSVAKFQTRIKKTFDPNDLGDTVHYMVSEE